MQDRNDYYRRNYNGAKRYTPQRAPKPNGYDEEQRRRYTAEEEAEILRRRRRAREEMRRIQYQKKRRIRLAILTGFALFVILFSVLVVRGGMFLIGKIRSAEQTKITQEKEAMLAAAENGNAGAGGKPGDLSEAGIGAVESIIDTISPEELEALYQAQHPAVEEEPQKSEEVAMFFDGYDVSSASMRYLDSAEVQSQYAVIIDLESGEAVAGRESTARMYPASMTKVLTLLTGVEILEDKAREARADGETVTVEDLLDETLSVSEEILNYTYSKGCSQAGFMTGEIVTVRDLLYGTILPSGGDAAMSLAVYTAGSEEAFVQKMNEKVAELGLSGTTHFTNSIGLFHEDHYTTCQDMAMILKAAVENDLCREVLSRHIYTTSPSAFHPSGIEISNWFLRRIEDKDNHGIVMAGKTGYVMESGNCAASYQIDDLGHHYVCVTGNAWSGWRAIYDHVAIYQTYTGLNAGVLYRDSDYETDLQNEEALH